MKIGGYKMQSCFGPIDSDGYYMQEYLGSVMSLMPSGKYYTAWANSNVTEKEAERDERERERMESAANEVGAWLESGEGDPTDIFLCWSCPPFELSRYGQAMVNCVYLSAKAIVEKDRTLVGTTDELEIQKIHAEYVSRLMRELGLMDSD
jgi:hypothetical protein